MANIAKIATGIKGLDSVLGGGYPAGSPILLRGSPGTGKTVFGLWFIYEQLKQGLSTILIACEEPPEKLLNYMDAFGMKGSEYHQSGKLTILDFRPNLRDQVDGDFSLTPILKRLSFALEKTHASTLVLDSLQNLLWGLGVNHPGKELLELFDWVRERQVTTLTTMSMQPSRDDSNMLEEYSVDCVIYLSQNIEQRMMTRNLRVMKMRGSAHGTNEYPFALTARGVSLLPVTDPQIIGEVDMNRVSTGIATLDEMLGGEGYFRGTTLIASGKAGCGKTILGFHFALAAIKAGQKVLFVSFEESQNLLQRNLLSVGLDLAKPLKQKQLVIHAARAVEKGLEDHLIEIMDLVTEVSADFVILDPISALIDLGSPSQVKMMMVRFVTNMKSRGTTLLMTELLSMGEDVASRLMVSSLADSWLSLRQIESNGEFNRLISVIKSRGSKTSNQVKEFNITSQGIAIEEPYIGDGEVVVGSEKVARIALDEELVAIKQYELQRIEQEMKALQQAHEANEALQTSQYQVKLSELQGRVDELKRQAKKVLSRRASMQEVRR